MRKIRTLGNSRLALLMLSVCSMGTLLDCPGNTQPPSIPCSDFSLFLEPGACVTIANPCVRRPGWPVDGQWVNDGFRLFGEPASVYVKTERDSSVTRRSICSAGDEVIVNQSLVFNYGILNSPDYGTGHVTLTVAPRLVVVASATPATIDFGDESQLVAQVSGGVPPYSYNWIPTTELTVTNTATPRASPSATRQYTVRVTDSAFRSSEATVTIHVNLGDLNVHASPLLIDFGEPVQLSASIRGGVPPYTFVWHPTDTLHDPTTAGPLAIPSTTTTYSVVVTDANGVTRSGSVEVRVKLFVNPTATPTVIDSGQSSQLDVFLEGGDGHYTYAWSPVSGLSDPTIRRPIASPTATTDYVVTVTDGHGVAATNPVRVTVNSVVPPPVASFTVAVTPNLLTVDASGSTGGIASYQWELSWTSASPDLETTSPTASFSFGEGDRGTITLTVTNAAGQTATVSRSFPR